MKRRYFLLALLASLSLSGCDAFSGLFPGNNEQEEQKDDDKKKDEKVEPKSISLSEESISLNVGESTSIEWTVLPQEADQEVRFQSFNTSVCTVSTTGTIYGEAEGETTVRVISKTKESVTQDLYVIVEDEGDIPPVPPTPGVTYTVTYNANGATSGSVPTDSNQYNANSSVTVKGNTGSLAKTNYTWSGWNTKADGTGVNRAAGSSFTINSNVTLYAKWTSQGGGTDDYNGYYDGISTTATGNTLKTQLYNLIKGHTKYSYDNLEIAMRTTDRNWEKSPDPNDENPYMNLLYLVNNETKPSLWNTYHGSGGISDGNLAHWNKEHIWAKSNGFDTKSAPAYSDLHHLRASDKLNNGSRSNYAFTNTSGSYVKDYNGDNSGKLSSSSPKVYEPIDRDKGDVARALFYMATRYCTGDGSNNTSLSLTNGTDASGGKWGYLSTLLAWHTQDPPDAWEKNRNTLVQSFQGNRNPYIDHPEYAQKVFG